MVIVRAFAIVDHTHAASCVTAQFGTLELLLPAQATELVNELLGLQAKTINGNRMRKSNYPAPRQLTQWFPKKAKLPKELV